ncbi:MAG: hypothetical protein LBI78_05550 [Campylobacteraceae bacterium]|jgi:3-hydroxyacyl-[acyl-carrier-protein] dehydratase|nr:hypothetical protein [Campylobacteraceae bacterium]
MDTNLYNIQTINGNNFEVCLSNESHPVFKAHFSNNPILPGFIFLHICESALNITITEIARVKFITFVKPCDILVLNISQKKDKIHAEFICKDKKVCTLNFKGEKVE